MSTLRQRVSNENGADAAVPMADTTSTLGWKDLDPWRQDNSYIYSRYRRQTGWKGCFMSILYLHNETVNIHTHLWGALWFIYLLFTLNTTLSVYPSTDWKDIAVFTIFLSSAVFCLAASALFHTCSCHSPEVSAACHRADYCGIVTLTCGSFFPCVYYAFYCQPKLQIVYLSAITVVSIIAGIVVVDPKMRLPGHRGTRTAVFIMLGLSAVAPVSHILITRGVERAIDELGLGYLFASGGLYISGALMYANRLPEKLWPGKFDAFGASHQIFHMNVVLAALAHHRCVIAALNHAHSAGGGCAT